MEETQSENHKSISINMGNVSQVSGQINVAGGNIANYQVAEGGTLNIYQAAPASRSAVRALTALADFIQSSPDISTVVIEFRTEFRSTHEQVELLTHYKDLHDQLHDLQFKCYNGIMDDARDFPADERAVDRMNNYVQDFKDIVKAMNKVATDPCMPVQEMEWIQDLNQMCTVCSRALESLDESPWKSILWNMNRILMNQPARINSLLNHTAQTLRLPELLKALAGVSSTIKELDLDSEKVAVFQSGLTALADLNKLLGLLVEDHHRWQMLEVEIRQAGNSIGNDLANFEISWVYVKSKADPLYMMLMEDWAMDLRKDSALVDEILKSNNSAKLNSKFRSYQRGISRHFYQVDKDLKSLCGELSKIGMPLTVILEMIS
jgi:hypothetical protein